MGCDGAMNSDMVGILVNKKINRISISGLAALALGSPADTTFDPLYGGIFTTAPPYVNVGEYHPPSDRQDVFDWKLSQVRHFQLS